MKNIYVTLSGVLCSFLLSAQPTITDSINFPPSGYTVPVSIGSAPGGPGSPGASQTWDWSGLSLTTVGAQTYINPSATPYTASWPAANIGFFITNPGPTQYQYLIGSPTKMEFLATEITTGPGSGNDYSPNPQTILKFPFNFGDTITDVYQKVSNPVTSVLLTYDGYGTLIMPGGNTYTNVVRIQFTYSGGDDYVFWSTNPLLPLVIYNYTGNAVTYFGAPATGVNNEQMVHFSLYPNPSSAKMHIKSDETISNITCFNAIGQSLALTHENKVIDISHLEKGLYYLILTTVEGHQGISSFSKE